MDHLPRHPMECETPTCRHCGACHVNVLIPAPSGEGLFCQACFKLQTETAAPAFKKEYARCMECDGTGRDEEGRQCFPCNGKGRNLIVHAK